MTRLPRPAIAVDGQSPPPEYPDRHEQAANGPSMLGKLREAGPSLVSCLLLTILPFWVGWIRTNATYRALGIGSSLLNFGPPDYAMRSAQVFLKLLVPVSPLVCAALLSMKIANSIVLRVDRQRALSAATYIAWAGCLVMASVAWLAFAWLKLDFLYSWRSFFPLVFLFGSLLVLLSAWARRSMSADRSRGLLYAAVSAVAIGCFWALGIFAEHDGREQAEIIRATAPEYPFCLANKLGILGDKIEEVKQSDGRNLYCYNDLFLVIRNGNYTFLMRKGGAGDPIPPIRNDEFIIG